MIIASGVFDLVLMFIVNPVIMPNAAEQSSVAPGRGV